MKQYHINQEFRILQQMQRFISIFQKLSGTGTSSRRNDNDEDRKSANKRMKECIHIKNKVQFVRIQGA